MEVDYTSDSTGGEEKAKGSDNRLNVSSRADGRGYYNSRDNSESYVFVFNDANCSVGDYTAYLKNDKTDGKHMVIRSASVNSDTLSAFEIVTVAGTAAGGAVTSAPANLNQAGVARSATVTAATVVDSYTTPISGLTDVLEFDHVNVSAGGHEEFRFQDEFRLGQNQAIAIKVKVGTGVSCFGVIFFYFE